MKEEDFPNVVMSYLTDCRMCALGNLANHFGRSVKELTSLIQRLEAENRLRLSSPHCGSHCSTCPSCDFADSLTALPERTIVISLERKEQQP